MKSMFFYFLVLFNCSLSAQTLDPYKFFPSAVGNVWEYSYSTGLNRFEIVSDSLLPDSSKYIYYAPNTDPVYRIDKNYNVFWIPTDSVLNWHYYKLDVDSGDHWMVRPETSELQRWEAQVRDKYPAVFFGHPTTIMEITFYKLNWGDTVINQFAWPRFTMTLGYGIGEIMEFDEEGGGPYKILQGCIIDGDTIGIITSVKDEFNFLKSFELFQNYPNPFNPTTTIKFNLAEPQKVKLTVYSLLGEEVKVLIDEYKSSGTHSIVFNANDLSSGVYIYTIVAGNRTASKKLILLK
ncbi:MAG: hypothetical protein BroJett005_09130 [Ignavibacteriota bacterium]|nr:MAG: hypothetical protein BroJett005_09130 [Ignavibacteriota bacterium]